MDKRRVQYKFCIIIIDFAIADDSIKRLSTAFNGWPSLHCSVRGASDLKNEKELVAWIQIDLNPKGGLIKALLFDLQLKFFELGVAFDILGDKDAPAIFKRKKSAPASITN